MKKNLPYYLGFSHFLGIGPVRFDQLVAAFGSVREAYEARGPRLEEIIGGKRAAKFGEFRRTFDPLKKLEECEAKNITIITREDESYPKPLLTISDPPICLYLRGSFTAIDFQKDCLVAVVGTRKPTAYGIQVTETFAAGLAAAGCVIVSGMALGVDTIAHQQALLNKVPTVAVLGCGVDIIYPPSNKLLYEEIIKKGSAVISEFPPGMTVLPGFFIARNRIVSGLSHGTLVVEGAADSGALVTARYAAVQGREVFACPAPITSLLSAAPNILLKEGATPVTAPEDILNGLGQVVSPKQKKETTRILEPAAAKVYDLLSTESLFADEIVAALDQPVQTVLHTLSMMELESVIEKNIEGKYQIKI